MTLILLKTAGRTALRRPFTQQLRPAKPNNSTITRRHNATKPSQPHQKPIDAASQVGGTSIPVPNTVAALPLWQRLGPLTKFFSAYARSQRQRPYLTQFVSSLVIYFLGDMSAQSLSGEDYDPKRTLRSLMIGAGSSIPSYKWFMFLGSHFNYPSAVLSLATKVVVNQIVFTPIFNSYFFGMQSLLSNFPDFSPENVWAHIQRTVPTSFVNSCKLWPAVTAFSFTFIGAQYRSVFAGVIAIGWQTYLSFLNRKAEEVAERLKLSESEAVVQTVLQTPKDTAKPDLMVA